MRQLDPWPLLGCAILLAILAGLTGGIVLTTGGNFSYSLDDPYIHLAVAENLLQGHYGINIEEAAAPSSSILYPFLLAATLALGMGQFGPLVINAVAACGVLYVVMALLRGQDRLFPPGSGKAAVVVALVLLLLLNLPGLALTGMEHVLHLLSSLLVLYGLMRTLETRRVPGWLVCVIILNPLVRFEGVALSGAGVLALCCLGHWRAAGLSALGLTVTLGGFSAWLLSLGLGPLPSSIIVKSPVMTASVEQGGIESLILGLKGGLTNSLSTFSGKLLIGLLLLTLARAVLLRPFRWRRAETVVALTASLAIVGHLLAGRYGWFARYEIYIALLAVVTLLHVWRTFLWHLLPWLERPLYLFVFVLIMVVLSNPYSRVNLAQYSHATLLTPQAAKSIYLQQYQIHRFVTDYWRAPVAVNDLGWVSFRNDRYVLDLWGLGSEAARRNRLDSRSGASQWMERLVHERQVGLVMIYRDWFEAYPKSWKLMGLLKMEPGFRTAARDEVAIFATSLADKTKVRSALAAFSRTLPEGAMLEMPGA